MSNSVKLLFQCIQVVGEGIGLKSTLSRFSGYKPADPSISSSLKQSSNSPDETDVQFEGLPRFVVPAQRGVSNCIVEGFAEIFCVPIVLNTGLRASSL